MTLNCKGKLIDISTPKVMGILNVTPDSFYDGGRYNDMSTLMGQVEKMLSEGATFIDVGAYSSRPNAEHVDEDAELNRIIPMVDKIIKNFPDCLISIDTFRSKVADLCIKAGASIINDISAGLLDKNMLSTVGALGVPYVMMHMKGTPQTMQKQTHYEDLVQEIIFYFSERIAEARSHQIKDIIIDPGFGFSKTIEQNYELLKKLELLKLIDLPLMVGISRKSMIYKILETDPINALNGTTALNTAALLKGVSILRVHDVKEAMECITLTNQLH